MGLASIYDVMFFIGIVVVLLALSESKIDRTSDQESMSFNLHHDNLFLSPTTSMIGYMDDNKTPTPLETTLTTAEIESVSSNVYETRYALNPQPNSYTSLFSVQKGKKCEQLDRKNFPSEIIDILSPEILLQADPVRYLVDKTIKVQFRSMSWLRQMLNRYLQADGFPRCYEPYARALSSLLRCWPDMDTAGTNIERIQKARLKKDFKPSFSPSHNSLSPELLELFSHEIFNDPIPPRRIFYKLINMPKNGILNVEAQLQKFIERTKDMRQISMFNRYHIWYADAVRKFLQNESALDDLKRDLVEIQRLTTSGRRSSPAEFFGNPPST